MSANYYYLTFIYMDLIPFGWDPFEGMHMPAFFQSAFKGSFPKVDVKETAKDVVVIADIPGIDPKKVNVEIGESALRLSGQVEHEKESKEKNFYRKERVSHSFERVIPLPCPVASEGVKATSKNGTLTITLPKKHPETFKSKKIPIEEE